MSFAERLRALRNLSWDASLLVTGKSFGSELYFRSIKATSFLIYYEGNDIGDLDGREHVRLC